MKFVHAAVLNTLTRVQRFVDDNGGPLGDIDRSRYRAILDDSVATLSAHAVTQTSSRRAAAAETVKERVLRNNLKINHMRPIATVAQAQLRQVPEFLALKMPPKNCNSRGLIAWASAMQSAAAVNESAFVDAGLPKDFLSRLGTATKSLETALATRGATKAIQVGATAGLDVESTRGRQAVKVLDSLVEPLIAGNLALLAQWKSSKRFAGRTSPVAATSVDAAASGPLTGPESLDPDPDPLDAAPTDAPLVSPVTASLSTEDAMTPTAS